MYELARLLVEEKFGSILKLSKVIDIDDSNLYPAFCGTKPMFPKYKSMIAEALGTDERIFETEIDIKEYEKEKAEWERKRIEHFIQKYGCKE